jgi:DtxR family transcriptional regulator, manganese transport regulator
MTGQGPIGRFAQVRRDHAIETAADYVEIIEDLREASGEARGADICRILGVSHVTVSKTLQRLARDGYVIANPYRSVMLTAKGTELARASRERHELILQFLIQIGVPADVAETDSEGIEHHLSEATIKAIRNHLATDS